ncbi:hypothetical protein ACVWZ4_002856 [Bradyrhizobium sp. USDA 4472]
MGEQVNRACDLVVVETTVFPERVRRAASRLRNFFEERPFGSIGRDDFAAYTQKCTRHDLATEAAAVGGPMELACFDLRILGTIAGFSGEIALWELIQMWIEERQPAGTGGRP